MMTNFGNHYSIYAHSLWDENTSDNNKIYLRQINVKIFRKVLQYEVLNIIAFHIIYSPNLYSP